MVEDATCSQDLTNPASSRAGVYLDPVLSRLAQWIYSTARLGIDSCRTSSRAPDRVMDASQSKSAHAARIMATEAGSTPFEPQFKFAPIAATGTDACSLLLVAHMLMILHMS
jgi:hypothetical protein